MRDALKNLQSGRRDDVEIQADNADRLEIEAVLPKVDSCHQHVLQNSLGMCRSPVCLDVHAVLVLVVICSCEACRGLCDLCLKRATHNEREEAREN